MSTKPNIGVSGCLMGHQVRFDGGHKRNKFITDILSEHMEMKTVCPEMSIGLGSPRPAIRLQDIDNELRLVVSKDTETDLTDTMLAYSNSILADFSNLDGFIFKKGSPTCGAWRVPVVVHKEGHRRHDGTGLFARAFMQRYPWIPVEEEGRLNDHNLRSNFLERVYALNRWHKIPDADNNLTGLIDFHASHKLMLMARSQVEYQRLGRWVANTTQQNLQQRRHEYLEHFMSAMNKPISKGRHINVLMHIMGYLKKKLSSTDKKELLGHFEAYRNNYLPWISLIILIGHHLRKYPVPYLERQHYFAPYPLKISN